MQKVVSTNKDAGWNPGMRIANKFMLNIFPGSVTLELSERRANVRVYQGKNQTWGKT